VKMAINIEALAGYTWYLVYPLCTAKNNSFFHLLHQIEEQILECLAWSHDSPLWSSIQQAGSVPSCEEVSIPFQLEAAHSTQNLLASPIIHPRVQRICGEEGAARRGERMVLDFRLFTSKNGKIKIMQI